MAIVSGVCHSVIFPATSEIPRWHVHSNPVGQEKTDVSREHLCMFCHSFPFHGTALLDAVHFVAARPYAQLPKESTRRVRARSSIKNGTQGKNEGRALAPVAAANPRPTEQAQLLQTICAILRLLCCVPRNRRDALCGNRAR